MRTSIGLFFVICGYVAFGIFGLWGFFMCLYIVHGAAGFWGIVIGIAVLPMTFVAAPFYALVHNGNWFPLVIIYGGWVVAGIFYGIGSWIKGGD